MALLDLERVVVGFGGIEGAVEREPSSGVWRARIHVWARSGRLIRSGAGGNLIQVFGDVQTIGVHTDVADAQAVVGRKLAFHSDVPLICLRVAVIGIDTLIEAAPAVLDSDCGRRGVGELNERRAVSSRAVGVGM